MSDPIHSLYRVVRVDGGWRVRAANGAFATGTVSTVEEATAQAKSLAEGHGWARIAVHAEDGHVVRQFVWSRERRERAFAGQNARNGARPSWA